jgi:hypothetical protein
MRFRHSKYVCGVKMCGSRAIVGARGVEIDCSFSLVLGKNIWSVPAALMAEQCV